jgi:hypothetical protein
MSYSGMPLANRVNFANQAPKSTLDNVDPSQYQMIANIIRDNPGARLASFYGLRLYDVARVTAGTQFNSSEFELFATPVGQQTTEMNGTTQYTKSRIDTNMSVSRQLPASQEAWITSIQVRVLISGNLDVTSQTGNNLGLANNPGLSTALTASMSEQATNLAQAALESIYLKFSYNQTTFEEGPLYLFPSRYGISGYAGPVNVTPNAAGTGVIQNETAVNNGFGYVYRLPVFRHIESLYQFNVTLQALNTFTPTRNFRIQVILEGLGAKGVTG